MALLLSSPSVQEAIEDVVRQQAAMALEGVGMKVRGFGNSPFSTGKCFFFCSNEWISLDFGYDCKFIQISASIK